MATPLYGPAFGSYPATDVAWLLTDISSAKLEAPPEEREEAIQQGRSHYSESLPVEFQPSEAYYNLYHRMVEEHAEAMAHQVAVVGEKILALRGPAPVLVSLARAGTPVGVLVKRYLEAAHGLTVPHYTLSIIRGRGIDQEALRYLTAHHDPASVIFIDGWTGKGAITKELAEALASYNRTYGTAYSPELAVLADPGEAVSIYGTREDYLIPSACLNSTVSGLISRTVYNTDVLKPGEFHGGKFYRELQGQDVSNQFIEAVARLLPQEPLALTAEEAAPGEVTFRGWRKVEEVAKVYGMGTVNLVKPGVGETTRVLLRRVPEVVLVNPERAHHLQHILLLCEERGIPLREEADLVYSCVGLIAPKNGTGFDGRAALRG